MRAISCLLVLACAAAVSGCAFGVGPVVGLSRAGPTVGFLGGGGPGARWYAVRAEVGVMVESGGVGAYPVAGATGMLIANPEGKASGGAFATFQGARDGIVYGGGALGVYWSRPRDEVDCREHGWVVTVGVRRARGERLELFVWPQYVAYSLSNC